MKLVSCYIKGFGKLSNKDIEFDQQGITSFVEDNGYGKSTLASFIKAMLFGMETIKENDKDFKDRKHFAPFNGSDYGGTITFIHDNKEYRVERSFDKKSSAEDKKTKKIYIDGKETQFDGEIGETLLKLNKEAFERLLFINSEDTKMELQGNIRQQLNNLIDTTVDGINYDEVQIKYEKLSQKYKSKSGKNGLIPELEKKIKDNKILIEEKKQICAGINGKIDELKKEEDNLNIYVTKRNEQNSYQSILNSINEKKSELNNILSKYPNGLPSSEKIDELQQLEKKKIGINASLDRINDEEDYHKLKTIFLNGIPTEDEISELEKITTSNQLTDDDKALVDLFGNHNVDKDYIEVNKLFSEYKDLDEEIKSIPSSSYESCNKPKVTKIPLILSIIAIVTIVTGLSLIAINLIPVIVLCVIGFILLLLAGFCYLKNKIDSSNNTKTNVDNTKQIRSLNEIKEKINMLFTQYDICVDSVDLGYDRFKEKYNRYNTIRTLEQNISGGNQKISNILNKYNISIEYKLEKLKSDINSFIDYRNELKVLKEDLELTLGNINDVLEEYKIKDLYEENISNNIKRDREDINDLNQKLNELNLCLDNVEKTVLENNYDQLIDETNKKIASINEDIKRRQTASEEIEKLNAEINDDIDLLNKYKHRYKIINKTKSIIDDSQKALDKKYVEPIKKQLDNYFNLIEASSSSIKKIILGRDFDIQLDINGEIKSSEHLSSGQKSICALCYRLALLDNIFSTKEFPFIIMDDPFVNLDSNNFKMISNIIKTISQQKQIIYFSCHDSRKI